MRRIPGIAAAPTAAVVMSDHRSSVRVAGPPTARRIATCDQCAIGVTAGEDVVPGRCHIRALLGERRIPGEIDARAVEFLDARSDLDTLRIDPRAATDPVSRVNGWRIP